MGFVYVLSYPHFSPFSSLRSPPPALLLAAVANLYADCLVEIDCVAAKAAVPVAPAAAASAADGASSESKAPTPEFAAVSTDAAPLAIGPYSQAIVHPSTGMVYVSGCIALPPAVSPAGAASPTVGAGGLIGDTAAAQCTQSLANMARVLEAAGSDMSRVLKTTVLLTSMSDYAAVNAAYAAAFGSHKPARSCFAVKVGSRALKPVARSWRDLLSPLLPLFSSLSLSLE